jgi:hypothetical protein
MNHMRSPLISVCMPTYNQSRYIAEAIESVLAQSDVDLELIVVDDCSSDGTGRIVRSIADARIRYHRHDVNGGCEAARNTALRLARGEYVAWLDSDDRYNDGALSSAARVLDAHPHVALVHGGFDLISETGEALTVWEPPFREETIEKGGDAFDELIVSNYITTSTVVCRWSALDAAGPFATDIGGSSTDWEMWLRLALVGDVAYTPQRRSGYRVQPESISTRTIRSGERLRCDIRVVEGILARHATAIHDPERRRLEASAALAARALMSAIDAILAGETEGAPALVRLARERAPTLLDESRVEELLAAIDARDEYTCHRVTRALLGSLYTVLQYRRFGERIRKSAVADPEWEASLKALAHFVSTVVPADATIAVIDKWDPTILHLSGRRGYHFPHRELLPTGFPDDSGEALEHLRALVERGVTHLVVPSAASWWLEVYAGLGDYLTSRCRVERSDGLGAVYELNGAQST